MHKVYIKCTTSQIKSASFMLLYVDVLMINRDCFLEGSMIDSL